jgi:hypothetical protein
MRRFRIPRPFDIPHHAGMDTPAKAVREIALWLHANSGQVPMGASAPFIRGIAINKPPVRRIASLEQREADRRTWQWWLGHSGDAQDFCRAVREREGIDLSIFEAKSLEKRNNGGGVGQLHHGQHVEPKGPSVKADSGPEVEYWTRELGVDEDTLRDLVRRKKGSLESIRKELREIRRRGG